MMIPDSSPLININKHRKPINTNNEEYRLVKAHNKDAGIMHILGCYKWDCKWVERTKGGTIMLDARNLVNDVKNKTNLYIETKYIKGAKIRVDGRVDQVWTDMNNKEKINVSVDIRNLKEKLLLRDVRIFCVFDKTDDVAVALSRYERGNMIAIAGDYHPTPKDHILRKCELL